MDAGKIETLCVEMGAHAAEEMLCRAFEDLGQRLLGLQELSDRQTQDELHKALKGLAAIADQIGLCGLACVARDVMTCIEYGDLTAQAATTARLERMGERSLSALWDLQDLSV